MLPKVACPYFFLLLAGCSCEPNFLDCQLRCGAKNSCPQGLQCAQGFCRQPNPTGTCTCVPGEKRDCGGDAGECNPGTQTCGSDRQWGACVGEGVASPEVCDGKDNDCNGAVDDATTDGQSCAKRLGVCAGKRQGCVNGQFLLGCSDADYGPDYQPVETRCDGLDNDCDGRVDSTRPAVLSSATLWALVGFDGGYGLITAVPTGATSYAIQGTLYSAQLAALGVPNTLYSGTGVPTFLSAVARGDRAVVAWAEQAAPPTGPALPAALEWTRLAPSAPQPFAGLPPAGDRGTGAFAMALPAVGALGAHLADDGGAQVLSWSAPPLSPGVAPLSAPGLTFAAVDAVSLSSGGLAVRWSGAAFDDAGTQHDGGVFALVGGRSSRARPRGPLLEVGAALSSAWAESTLQQTPPQNESAVVVQHDVWDGGAFVLRQLPDYRGISSFAATAAPGGLFVAWAEFGALVVGTPTGGAAVRTAMPQLDAGVVNLQVANGGGAWNAVAWDRGGVNALLVCAP